MLSKPKIETGIFYTNETSKPKIPNWPNNQKASEKHKNDELYEHLREWAAKTTGHGLPQLVSSKRLYQKIIWLVFILISFSLCSFMITKSIVRYLEHDVTTRIRVEHQENIVFPAISFCNLNPFLSYSAYRYLRDYYETKYNYSFEFYTDLSYRIQSGQVMDETDWLLYQTYDPNFNMSIRKSFGYEVETMIHLCKFNWENCDLNDFEWYYNPLYGN